MPTRLSSQDNPALIHEGSPSSTPLFLIHDGGGTTFSYHCLEPLGNRTIYGIHNAHFDDGGFWSGGVAEMAAHYVDLITATMRSSSSGGDLLLGGWSLGGILSLEIAHQLAATCRVSSPGAGAGAGGKAKKYRVLGMVWIDTVFPQRVEGETMSTVVGPNELIVKTREELDAMKPLQKAELNMWHARRMMPGWKIPRWQGGDGDGSLRPPTTILLRAKERGKGDGQKFVDRTRQFRLLGWEGYNAEHGEFICDVVDVEGGHFDLFGFDKLEVISKQIETAVDDLEKRARAVLV